MDALLNLLPAAAFRVYIGLIVHKGALSFPIDLRFLVHLENSKLNLVSDGRTARGREWLRKIACTPIGSEVWWR
jgi:hypothetical protein